MREKDIEMELVEARRVEQWKEAEDRKKYHDLRGRDVVTDRIGPRLSN